MTRTQKLTVACGSPSYNCPEIVAKRHYHGVPADVWSSGVLLYVMLVGAFPFTGSTHESLNRRILAGQYKCPASISPAAQDLIRRCLQVDPERRASVVDMLEHPWLREGGPMPKPVPRPDAHAEDVISTLESLGLPREDSRDAYEAMRKGERSHATAAYELLAAKRPLTAPAGNHVGHPANAARASSAAPTRAMSASRRPETVGAIATATATTTHATTSVGPLKATSIKPQVAHVSMTGRAAHGGAERTSPSPSPPRYAHMYGTAMLPPGQDTAVLAHS